MLIGWVRLCWWVSALVSKRLTWQIGAACLPVPRPQPQFLVCVAPWEITLGGGPYQLSGILRGKFDKIAQIYNDLQRRSPMAVASTNDHFILLQKGLDL